MNNKILSFIKLIISPKSILGIIISIIGIYFAFKEFDYYDFFIIIKDIEFIYLIIATIFLWITVWLRAVRWRFLFSRNLAPSIYSLYKCEMIGLFGNNVLPLRLGELLRTYILAKERSLSKSFVFGTVILERITDTITLLFFVFLLLISYPLEYEIQEDFISRGTIILSVVIIFFIIIKCINTMQTENKIIILIKNILQGILSIRKDMMVYVIISSLLIWSIYLFDIFLLQKAFRFNLDLSQLLAILVISSFAISIPSAPGMIGTFHIAVQYTIVEIFGYSAKDGNSFAIVMHAYGFILFTIIGAYFFIKSQFKKEVLANIIKNQV